MTLSPESSTWGRNADLYFGHLLALLYTVTDKVDSIYICGDVNSRIGDLKDYVEGDDISPCMVLDTSVNKQGHTFMEFLKDSKCCILNGRLNPENDNFISISVRGKAVVDYIVTSHVDMKTCIGFNVYTPSELIDRGGPESFHLIGDHSRLPDHSVLCLRFQVGEVFNTQNNVDCPQQVKRQSRKYPVDFLSSEMCRRVLLEVIDQLQIAQENQEK